MGIFPRVGSYLWKKTDWIFIKILSCYLCSMKSLLNFRSHSDPDSGSTLECFCWVEKANSAFHPSGVSKWVPASAGKAKAGVVHSVSGWMQGVQVKLWDPSALEVCSRQGAIQILTFTFDPQWLKMLWTSDYVKSSSE